MHVMPARFAAVLNMEAQSSMIVWLYDLNRQFLSVCLSLGLGLNDISLLMHTCREVTHGRENQRGSLARCYGLGGPLVAR